MAQLRIKGNVKIGRIYLCDFGRFKKLDETGVTTDAADACCNDYNYRIPVEIIKRRPVVVIGKHKGIYLVVPISSTEETARKDHKKPTIKGFHIKLDEEDFPHINQESIDKSRWAKSNLITAVDGGRLTDLYDHEKKEHIEAHPVSEKTLRKIREGVIISIGMKDVLDNEQP